MTPDPLTISAATITLEAPPPPDESPAASLLETLLDEALGNSLTAARGSRRFDAQELLNRLAETAPNLRGTDAARLLDVLAARIEQQIAAQVNAILHHSRFQALEASWRGLEYLCRQAQVEIELGAEQGERVNVALRLLCVAKHELLRDAQEAAEFDQTALWKAVYEHEFGTAGGKPFGLLVGDYQFRADEDDRVTLRSIATVAAAAFAPFVAAAAPQMFGLDDFQRLPLRQSLSQDFQRPDYIKWRAFRGEEDARFVGLTLPRVLMRVPYRLDPSRRDGFRFREAVAEEGQHGRYLWGNAAYAFAAVVLRAYAQSGWFADLRGFERGEESGGLVAGLAVDSHDTDRAGIALKTSTDVVIGGELERELSELGFIPLCPCQGTEYSVFYSNASLQQPKSYTDAATTTTARMSGMLQYILCASRFAHFLKSICREKLGSFQDVETVERDLSGWINRFVTDDPTATPQARALHPLRQAEVTVERIPGTGGGYQLKMQLLPHYQLDALSASLRLVHRLTTGDA